MQKGIAWVTSVMLLTAIPTLGWGPYYLDAIAKEGSSFFAWDDEYRGMGTRAADRALVWEETWNLFLPSQVLGFGFRVHERFLKIDSSPHNGYLAVLAKIGLVRLLCFMYLIVREVRRLYKHTQVPTLAPAHSLSLRLASAYLLVALFERYLVNVGNPTSLLFLSAIMRPASSMSHTQTAALGGAVP